MISTSRFLVFLLSTLSSTRAASDSPPKPCTIHSPATGSFIDLRPLQLTADGTKYQSATNESYHAKGYDYPSNFSINFCGPAVEKFKEVEGIGSSYRSNVSAFYTDKHGDHFSIGQENTELLFRGKKLLMNYTQGSPCPELDQDGVPIESRSLWSRKLLDDDDDDDDEGRPKSGKKPSNSKVTRRKNTMLSFICDTSPSLSTRPAISFLGTPDHCTYIFEVRSRYACGGTSSSGESGTLGPGGVFAVILAIALLVYLIGGVVYQRNVMHQRGWRQLPNYAVWAGLFGFVSDMFIILFSSCFQRMPSLQRAFGGRRSGYHRVGTDDMRNGNSRGRGRTPDDENRLIDSYDEEWDS